METPARRLALLLSLGTVTGPHSADAIKDAPPFITDHLGLVEFQWRVWERTSPGATRAARRLMKERDALVAHDFRTDAVCNSNEPTWTLLTHTQ